MAELNKAVAAELYRRIRVTVRRWAPKLTVHPKAVFLGYADVIVETLHEMGGKAVDLGHIMQLRGIEVKILNGNLFLDMPGDFVKEDGKKYPYFFPLSAEFRAVLTARVGNDERIAAAFTEGAEARGRADAQAQASQASAPAQSQVGAEVEAKDETNPFEPPAQA